MPVVDAKPVIGARVEGKPPELSILTARGLGCLLLVAFHVVGSTPQAGLRLPETSGWHYAMASIEFLRMPLFSVLSGYLYALRRPTTETISAFTVGKIRRIILPLIFATLVTFWLRGASFGPDVTLAHALLFHYQHFWFLQALFLIFMFMAICDLLRPPGWSVLLIFAFFALMLESSIDPTQFLSLDGAVYLLPFFCFGMILQLEPQLLERGDLRVLAGCILLIVIAAQQAGLLFGSTPVIRTSIPAAMAGAAVSMLLMIYLPSVAVLKLIGRFSYGIYIWHSICAAAMRTWLNTVVTLPVAAQFAIILISGILFPIGLQIVLDRLPIFPVVMLGKKPAGRSQ